MIYVASKKISKAQLKEGSGWHNRTALWSHWQNKKCLQRLFERTVWLYDKSGCL